MHRLQSECMEIALVRYNAQLIGTDSLVGSIKMRKAEQTLYEQVTHYFIQGRFTESRTCYEHFIREYDLSLDMSHNVIKCYVDIDQPETALVLAEGLWNKLHQDHHKQLAESMAEPLLYLSRFDELEVLTGVNKLKESSEWGVQCGQTFKHS